MVSMCKVIFCVIEKGCLLWPVHSPGRIQLAFVLPHSSPSWITALWQRGLCNSMKLWAVLCRATQDGQVLAECSDKTWSTGGGTGTPPQYTCHENLMNWRIKVQAYHQFSSVTQSSPTLCDPMNRSTPGLPVHHQLSFLKLMSIELVMPSSHLILCHPLLLLPPIPPSIRVFSNEWALCIRWPKYWSFSFSNSPSNEHAELISFRMVWLDLLAVQESLKSLLQHHSSKALILWHSAFFTV